MSVTLVEAKNTLRLASSAVSRWKRSLLALRMINKASSQAGLCPSVFVITNQPRASFVDDGLRFSEVNALWVSLEAVTFVVLRQPVLDPFAQTPTV